MEVRQKHIQMPAENGCRRGTIGATSTLRNSATKMGAREFPRVFINRREVSGVWRIHFILRMAAT